MSAKIFQKILADTGRGDGKGMLLLDYHYQQFYYDDINADYENDSGNSTAISIKIDNINNTNSNHFYNHNNGNANDNKYIHNAIYSLGNDNNDNYIIKYISLY